MAGSISSISALVVDEWQVGQLEWQVGQLELVVSSVSSISALVVGRAVRASGGQC